VVGCGASSIIKTPPPHTEITVPALEVPRCFSGGWVAGTAGVR
jgi:hypothetical protein